MKIGPKPKPLAEAAQVRRLAAEADLKGNADGVAEGAELSSVVAELAAKGAAGFDLEAGKRLQTARRLANSASTTPIATLDSRLQRAPEAVRRLALEIDTRWGNADGSTSLEEINRVATYYLAALPFFGGDAGTLLELSSYLGFDKNIGSSLMPRTSSLFDLRCSLRTLSDEEVQCGRPFRELFDEAVAAGERPGDPELLRDLLLHSPRWHQLSILEHTAVAVDVARALSEAAGLDWRDSGGTMLLHDVGKVLDRSVDPTSKEHHFTDHDENGARWLEERGISGEIAFQIRHHGAMREKSVAGLTELAGGDRDRLARMVVVYLADQTAKGRTPEQLRSLAKQMPKLRQLGEKAGLDMPALEKAMARLRVKWFIG